MLNIEETLDFAPLVPSNPLNTTLVSLLPYAIKELKPQIIPGYFQIPAARGDNAFQILSIGESIHWMESPYKGMPPIKMTETSKSVAKSVVNDFQEAQIAIDHDAAPGFFYIEGDHDRDEVAKHFKMELGRARERQNNWFIRLIRMAEDDWAKTHQHQAISDVQRYAAKYLGMNVEWLSVTMEAMQIRCPLCSEFVRPEAIVHSACGYILKPTEYALMKANLVPKEGVSSAKA